MNDLQDLDALLILNRVRVENANAVQGLTYGFPAIPQFLGFTHALERNFAQQEDLKLVGCGVVVHQHQTHCHRTAPFSPKVFALTRNPLDKSGKTAAFNEEGKMHMTVSLVIAVEGRVKTNAIDSLKQGFLKQAQCQRLAGGLITSIKSSELNIVSDDEDGTTAIRKFMRQLLPGFALVNRGQLLADHYAALQESQSEVTLSDAWLDFSALKYSAPHLLPKNDNETLSEEEKAQRLKEKISWVIEKKAFPGWLVPIMVGYRAISELYQPGEVAKTRDPSIPFRFVESVYSIGEWINPIRLKNIEDLLWTYRVQPDDGWYLAHNTCPSRVSEN